MTDNELLDSYFKPVREMQLPDNGFSVRVMQHLPAHARKSNVVRLCHLWTAFCIFVALALFVAMRGWEIIAYGLLMLANTPQTQQQLLMLAVSAAVVGTIILLDVIQRQRYVI